MSIFNNITEPTFALLGFAVGVIYGLDGWRGSSDNLSFFRQPRIRNLSWVIGVGFLGFLSRLVFEDVSRARLLFFYFLAFVIGTIIIVVGWGLIIFVSYSYERIFHPDKYPPPPFSPFIDYFFYGYSFVREEYSKGLERLKNQIDEKRHEFLPEYGGHVSKAIAAISAYTSTPTEERRAEITKAILDAICAVMHLYNFKVRDLKFNANCMIAYPKDTVPEAVLTKLKFGWGDRARYAHYLALYVYADNKGAQDFSLPVEDGNLPGAANSILPGGPQAYLINETVIVDNTQDMAYALGVPGGIREEIRNYFKGRKSFQSFACLNIVYGGRQVGLVNIESNQLAVFGNNQEHKDELESLLFPFCFLLGFLIEGVAAP